MNAAGHQIERIVMCGGGTKNPYWLRENADATGCEIHLVSEEDAVTLGAALLGRSGEWRICVHARRCGATGAPWRQCGSACIDPRLSQRQIRDLFADVPGHGPLPHGHA
jgi:hypothetical protein